ncbi:unnamed protein product, partial [Closterium sp. NIES-53]
CVDLHVYMDGPSPAQVSASGPVAPPCSCRLLSHQNLLWHHCLGHPSLPRLRGMHSHLLVSGLSKSLPPLPPLPATPCLPFVEGRQRGAPHSSSFPATTTSLQTLHMDVWGPARDLPVLRLHSDRGGEFSSNLLRDFYHGEGVLQSFALPASPQQNGIAEHRIGLVMETSPTLRWTGKIGDASVFWVWGSRAFVCDTSADKLSACAIPCVFLGFPTDVPGGQFYHPTSRRVLSSQDILSTNPLLGAVPVEVAVDSGAARGAAYGGAAFGGAASGGAEPARAEPGGAEPEGAGSGGAEPGGARSGGAEPEGAELRGAESEGAESGGAEPARVEPVGALCTRAGGSAAGGTRAPGPGGTGAAGAGGAARVGAGGTGVGAAGGTGAAGPGGARIGAAGGTGGACTGGTGGAGAGGAAGIGAGDPGAGDTGTGGASPWGAGVVGASSGGTGRPRPYFVPLLQQVLGLPSSIGLTPPLLCPPPDRSQPP